MSNTILAPDYLFESSWEVCNKVGGIYTVLSTRAKTLQSQWGDKLIFVGPDLWQGKANPLFVADEQLYERWVAYATTQEGLKVRVGRWQIPGSPVAILVDFNPFYPQKNEIYGKAWEYFGIDSLHAYGDYDEASMFSYAAAKVVESFYRYSIEPDEQVVYQAHEWMTGMGALYLKRNVPQIATIFTTHATSIGRSIAGNHKPLYEYLWAYNGCQMAQELNVESKHSVERQTAHQVDCFTTVSEITNNECRELLDKEAHAVLVNGFEDDFVPKGLALHYKRSHARGKLLHTANCLMGTHLDHKNTLIISTSGRYEFKNKGIDVFIESLNLLRNDPNLTCNILALINVPAWMKEPRADLQQRLGTGRKYFSTPLPMPFITHHLHNMDCDQVLQKMYSLSLHNAPDDKVKIMFVPCYQDGADGILNEPYYDMLPASDLTVYPSYYEPWGYTPLESTAFHVPTITTDLAGFGLWVNGELGRYGTLKDGVRVLHRTDSNSSDVAQGIKDTICEWLAMSKPQQKAAAKAAANVAEKAHWQHFAQHYYTAYDIALRNCQQRLLQSNLPNINNN